MPAQAEQWQAVFFKRHPDDDPSESRPGFVFLNSCPVNMRARLLAFLFAVRDGPPPNYRPSQTWHVMHDEMAGYYEIRARGGDTLYRLFCILERPRPGLERPSVIVITGMTKPVRTGFSDADYASVRALGDEYRRRSPRSVSAP